MSKNMIRKIGIIILLGLLTISAFFVRLRNFESSDLRSIDEIVYARMAVQIQDGLGNYNTIPYGKQLADAGRDLPEYFFQPLFKHPPVFTLLVSLFMRLFGTSMMSAGMVSVLLSSLMIPLIFILGKMVYKSDIVALFSALFLWLDPVSIITSQKVWPDTTIAFFTLLSIVFFIYGLDKKNGWFYILSGISSGFAMNTKYTGVLITMAIVIFAITYRRDLFSNIKFLLGLIMPFILLSPWLIWNYKVYGLSSILQHKELMKVVGMFVDNVWIVILVGVLISAILLLFRGRYSQNVENMNVDGEEVSDDQIGANLFVFFVQILVIGVFIFVLRSHVINSLNFFYFPETSWQLGFFGGQPPSFYFGRLIEFFFLYFFSFISLLVFSPNEKPGNALIRISGVLIFVFFILWGNYQSRYILSCLPFFLLMGSDMLVRIYNRLSDKSLLFGRLFFRHMFVVFVIIIVIKVGLIDQVLSFPHDFCYY